MDALEVLEITAIVSMAVRTVGVTRRNSAVARLRRHFDESGKTVKVAAVIGVYQDSSAVRAKFPATRHRRHLGSRTRQLFTGSWPGS